MAYDVFFLFDLHRIFNFVHCYIELAMWGKSLLGRPCFVCSHFKTDSKEKQFIAENNRNTWEQHSLTPRGTERQRDDER